MTSQDSTLTPTDNTALELWSFDELCEHAFAIFEELAEENLSAADYALYQREHQARAFADLVTPSDDWVDLTMADLEPELHIEAHIGLAGVDGAADMILARILLSREKHESLCHAQWRGQ